MLRVRYRGRLGNNLFQYAFARLMAEKVGLAFDTKFPYPQFKNAAKVPGKVIKENPKTIKENEIDLVDGTRRIYLRGYFQRAEYYLPHKERIKEWFYLPDSEDKVGPDDVVMHVRRFNYRGHKIDLNFYKNILDKIKYDKLYITGWLNIESRVCQEFAKYNPIIYDSGKGWEWDMPYELAVKDFNFIKQFRRILQSNSTYSWWAAFLSDAEEIYTPVPRKRHYGARGYKGHLPIDDDPRYINIEVNSGSGF